MHGLLDPLLLPQSALRSPHPFFVRLSSWSDAGGQTSSGFSLSFLSSLSVSLPKAEAASAVEQVKRLYVDRLI